MVTLELTHFVSCELGRLTEVGMERSSRRPVQGGDGFEEVDALIEQVLGNEIQVAVNASDLERVVLDIDQQLIRLAR